MSNYRQFQMGPSAEARQDMAFIRKATKDREREAFERAEANRRDGALDWENFSWERKRRVVDVSPEQTQEATNGNV